MNNIQSQIGTSNKELDFDQRQKLYVLPSTEERVKESVFPWTHLWIDNTS